MDATTLSLGAVSVKVPSTATPTLSVLKPRVWPPEMGS